MSDHKSEEVDSEHETSGFIFIYEANREFYSKLNDIEKTEGRSVTVHPVYYGGYENTMTSEDIVWNSDEERYISESSDGSWLDTMKEYPEFIFGMDESNVVYHEDLYYHCDGCLLQHLIGEVNTVQIQSSE